MTTGSGDGGDGVDTGRRAGPDPGTSPPPSDAADAGDADAVAEALQAVARQAAIDRTMFVAGVLDEEASTMPFESEVRPAGGQPADSAAADPAASAAADAAETERMVGEILDQGSRAMASDGVGPGTQPAETPAAARVSDYDAQVIMASAAALTEDRPAPEAGFYDRHRYNLGIAGLAGVALIAFVGALLLIGGSGGSAGPGATAVPSGGGGAIVAPSPAPTPTPSPTPTLTAAPTPVPVATPQSVTLRGPIDVTGLTSTGLSMTQHDAELVVFLDTNEVRGSFLMVVDRFPLGQIMASMDQAIAGSNDPDYEAFKACTVQLVLDGPVTGTFDPASGTMSGAATFQPTTNDVDDCLKTKPPNLTIDPDEATEPSTVKWSASFDGRTAKGSIALDPQAPFEATLEE